MPDVVGLLPELTPDSLRALFAETLRWDAQRGTQPLDVGAPLNRQLTLHRIAIAGGVRVFAAILPDVPTLSVRRAIFRALRPIAEEHLVIYCAEDAQQALFVWPRLRHAEGGADAHAPAELRVLPYEAGFPVRTTLEQLAKLRLPLDRAPTLETVLTHLADAFSVESVTERFFNDYKRVFEQLQDALRAQTQDARWAHDFALQTLNRLVFIYFIQRKRYAEGAYWLGNNPRFVRDFWRAYREQAANDPAANFYADWLCALFFAAFNQRFQAGRSDYRHFPVEIREALATMPYLNGGLFTENALDTRHTFTIPDAFFEQLFDHFDGSAPGFLERYNFTVSESTPLDVEVAVDPEMIGKVYESLVNLTERGATTEDRRGMAGIFYTPRTEIDLMCRLALVDALANRVSAERALLYDWVFAADPDDKRDADWRVTEADLWRALDDAVRSLTICDPACGSGSFLVGMLQVLDDLQARCAEALGREETPYDRRRRIVGEQLYGVDVMDWAVHVAELRLWLQLTVETDLRQPEAQLKPLLPNLSFKIRQGDSLVQEIGGVNLGLHHGRTSLPLALKGRITQLKARKLRFYQGDRALDEPMLRQEETGVFRDILKHRLKALEDELTHKRRALANLPVAQIGLGLADVGDHDAAAEKRAALEATISALEDERERVRAALEALGAAGQALPFVWDIAFVEVFADEAGGFDIVIGNPPYVRKQRIAPPNLDPGDFGGEHSAQWELEKQRYREKLLHLIEVIGPKNKNGVLSGWADLYVYFYFLSSSLLRPKGTLCFITPSSWLDVGYGRDLQAFFLKRGKLKLVIDNNSQRSFSQAEVNTIIVLFGNQASCTGEDASVRFMLFRRPFGEVSLVEAFKAAEQVRASLVSQDYRVLPVPLARLWQEGLAQHSDETGRSSALDDKQQYAGSKWGKYLRAPDIFHLLAKHARMIPVKRVAQARLGITTGANDFFFVKRLAPGLYVTTAFGEPRTINLPDDCLLPALRNVNECRRYTVYAEDATYHLLIPGHSPDAPLLRNYISAAEAAGINQRPFFRGKRNWHELGEPLCSRVIVPEIVYQRYFFAWNADRCALNKNFYGFQTTFDESILFSLLNFTFSFLYFELTGRKPGAGASGININVANQLPIVDPGCLDTKHRIAVREAAENMRRRAILSLDEELYQPDRQALDASLLDVLGLSRSARDDLYASLVDLVHARLSKARSADLRIAHD